MAIAASSLGAAGAGLRSWQSDHPPAASVLSRRPPPILSSSSWRSAKFAPSCSAAQARCRRRLVGAEWSLRKWA
eukprot:scaffold196525_cov32-Tisochrysis_lutea.AAC.2